MAIREPLLVAKTVLSTAVLSNNRVMLGAGISPWIDDFEYMQRTADWGVLAYTFHPFVVGRGHRMMMLERLISAFQERGACFTTMEKAALEFRDRSREA